MADWECAICLDDMIRNEDGTINLLGCGHAFHEQCLEELNKYVELCSKKCKTDWSIGISTHQLWSTHIFHLCSYRARAARALCPTCRVVIRKQITLIKSNQQINCVSCNQNVAENVFQPVCALDCGHSFHYFCLHNVVKNGPWKNGYVFMRMCPNCQMPTNRETKIFDLSHWKCYFYFCNKTITFHHSFIYLHDSAIISMSSYVL